MQSNTTTDIPTTEVDTRIPKEDLREAFGTLGDQTESIDINPKDQLKQEVIKDVQKETTFEKDKAEEFLKSTDVDRTFEKAQKDNKLVNLAKEKLPDTYGECDSILDIAKVTVKEVGKFNVRLTKEYYSIQLVVGGAMILATGLGGYIGRVVGKSLIGVGYKYSEFLNKNFKKEDISKIVDLYKKNKEEVE